MTVMIEKNNFTVYGQCSCLICGEGVPIYSPSERGYYKICDKCKEAVMHVRKALEQVHEGDLNVNSDPDKGPC